MVLRCAWLAVLKHVRTKLPLLSHNIEDEDPLLILTIKNATRWNHYLPVYRIRELWWNPSGLGDICQTLDLIEDFLDQMTCGRRVIQSNVLSDGIQFLKGRRRPDYFSHLLIFSLAWP